jgi:ATP-dependent Zn protease
MDAEVKRMLDSAYAEANRILNEHRSQLDSAASELLKCETMDAHRFNQLIGRNIKGKKRRHVALEACAGAA